MQPLLVNVPEILLMILLVVLFHLLGRNRSPSMRLWVATWCVIWVHFVVLASAALLSQPVLIILARGTLYFSGILFVVLLTAAVEFRSRWLAALGLFAVPGLAHTLAIALHGQNRAFYFACMLVFFAGIAFMAYRASAVQPKSLRALQVAALEVPFVVWGFYGTWQGHFVSGMFAMLAALFCLCGMLFWYSYRRVTPGVVISCAGFVSWGLVFVVIDFVQRFCPTLIFSPHTWNLPKIVVALGIIVALLEDESQLAEATANRLQAILEHAPVGICTCLENRFVETNTAFQRMTGYSGEELRQMDWMAVTHPDDVAHNAEAIKGLVSGELKGYDFEKRYVLRNGKTIWVRLVTSRLDEKHRISIVEDITQRKNAVEELRRSETRLRRLIDSNVIGIMIRRGDGSILDANDAFLKMTGYTREDIKKGLRWSELTPPEYSGISDSVLAELRQMGSFRACEKEYFRKDGSRIPVMICGASTIADEAMIFVLDLTEVKQAQAELRRLARIVETTDEAILSVTLGGRILSWNRGAERLFGYSADEILGRSVQILIPEDRKDEREARILPSVESGRGLEGYETFRITKLGERKPISLTISPIRDESGQIVGMSSIARDLTQVKKAQELEEQLRQAQKLESLGRLTGGVAHDFNNLLMVISSYTEMLEAELAPDDRLRKKTQQVLKAAARAASLTQQMLAFSRKQVLSPQVLDLNVVVDDTAKMLKRMIGEDVELVFLPSKQLWPVLADPGQMTQVLMNLGVNARDAMPKGGKLTIETQNVIVDAQTASCHAGFSSGRYVMIAVSDTGIGMTKDVQKQIFEPFFTTKENGKGTGLGLATVYGIIKQSGGYIWVYSEVGRGSCFKVYFPAPQSAKSFSTAVPLQISRNEGRGETILLVEDEDSLREAVHDYLRENGYEVLEASNGQEALEVAAQHIGGIHLLLTDVIMPKMSGPELARELSSREGMAVLLMSGYTDDAIVNHGVLQPGLAFLQKPFSLDVLGAKVRNVLDSRQTVGQDQDGGEPVRDENNLPPTSLTPISQISPMQD